MEIGFAEALLVLGVVLGASAALSGWLHGTVLSISVLSLVAGIALSLAGVMDVSPDSEVVIFAVELALILTLFSDGLLVERELLLNAWGPAARALVVAMPLTLGLLGLAAKLLFDELSWAEAFLLAAVLTPTDPVVTSSVVTSERVPRMIRHTLNLESGMNDGLTLPFVLFFLALTVDPAGAAGEGLKLVGEAVAGAAIGAALAWAGGWLLPRLPRGGVLHRYEGAYALAIALAAFGLAEVTYGNGLIAAFVAGIVLAVTKHEIPNTFSEFNETASAVFQVITFVLFGALVVTTDWEGSTVGLLVFIVFALLVARPVAVLACFVGVAMTTREKLFVAWFGPKGVASMLFALLVLSSSAPDRTLVFDAAAFVILGSILAHGLTDTVGSRWIERGLR